MSQSLASKQDVIFQTSQLDGKIYIREQKGDFQRIRRYLSWVLVSGFMLLPWVQYHGQQGILFNVPEQKLTLFDITLFPQDMFIFSLIFILAAFLLFYITRLYGRVWCGYTCPQTIWMLMFNWVERRVEGSFRQSQALDNAPLGTSKVIKKAVKHSIWLAISFLTALVFMSYFVPVSQLYSSVFTFQASTIVLGWVFFFTACTYINGGWIKEKMCLHICPYARFQSVMFSNTTTLITYDNTRGENRGPRKLKAQKATDMGDCVDCGLCVDVCPVGIDIRQGLQYECINCGLCADACNDVMRKFNYPRYLIKYAPKQESKRRWSAHLGYGVASLLCLCFIVQWAFSRDEFDVSIIRDRQALYRVNTQGKVENTFVLKIINKTQQTRGYLLKIEHDENLIIQGTPEYVVSPTEQAMTYVTVVARHAPSAQKIPIHFAILDQKSHEVIQKSSSFFSPTDAW
ncbi:Ferredoxin-type protein NapH [Paraglaciecola mesophila]|uniref:Ferredoxin-type protein NapH n=1 Tax=Paraglaciecola mesophila TaxID=197222 RepID=A0A857JPQ6_9ALTE|nr:cytochrome c oxidase accessory protein CcoG [Paraglaciecola mesophila]QHJ13120.1 Ferredoxin-type protein NapH [Paraglaciecola mesophila]